MGRWLAVALAFTACTAPVATPTASRAPVLTASPTVSRMTEAQAWSIVRGVLPPVLPVALPTWLPPTVDRTAVELRDLHYDSRDQRYAVVYRDGTNGTIVIGLGPVDGPVTGDSAIGTRVRGVPATISYPSSLAADPTKPARRRIRWQEGPSVLYIESLTTSATDLLHIAWFLDPKGEPPPKLGFQRTKEGACAKRAGSAEVTVRTLLSLFGTHDRSAAIDCFAGALLGETGPLGYGLWADLPAASDVRIVSVRPFAGRSVVHAMWTFASEPGGAWNRQATHFFTVGAENDRQRVYDTGTAALADLP